MAKARTISAEEAVARLRREGLLVAWYELGEVLVAAPGDPNPARRIPARDHTCKLADVTAAERQLTARPKAA